MNTIEKAHNPLDSMSTAELRRLGENDPNPIVRFACLREEAKRMSRMVGLEGYSESSQSLSGFLKKNLRHRN